MADKKVEGVQRPHTNVQLALWTIVVINFLSLQVVFTPSAFATSVSPPSGVSASTLNATTPLPGTEGGRPVDGVTTDNIDATTKPEINSASSGFVENNTTSTDAVATTEPSTTEPFSGDITTPTLTDNASSVEESAMPTSEKYTTISDGTRQTELSTQMPLISTTKSFTYPATSLNITSTSVDQTSEDTRTSPTTVLQTSFTSSTTTQESDSSSPSPVTPTPISTAVASSQIIPSATPESTSEVASPTPTSPSTSQSFPTGTPESTLSNVESTVSTVALYSTTWPADAMTTGQSGSGSMLTTGQWVGIGIAIGIFLALLVIMICLLIWMRTRSKLPSKKPSIRVSREEYSKSGTLALKDPQWRKSLTMALQSMNTHIELPKETDEEMQAVDNSAYVDESPDPQTSNQDPSHLTKV